MPYFTDIYCDLEWVNQRRGDLGVVRSGIRSFSNSLGIKVDILFFGDEYSVKHVRAILQTEDRALAQTCQDLNILTWIASIEVAIMLETKRSFRVARAPDTELLFAVLGEGLAEAPACCIQVPIVDPPKAEPRKVAACVSVWPSQLVQHLFYFRRLIDPSLPNDVRWLNGYKLLEWHFAPTGDLPKSPEWRAFLTLNGDELDSLLRPRQTRWGYLEEARALAAHAGMDKRSSEERARDPKNAMEKTMWHIEKLAYDALNSHPIVQQGPILYTPSPRPIV